MPPCFRPTVSPPANAANDPIAELKQLNSEVERLAWQMDNALKKLTDK